MNLTAELNFHLSPALLEFPSAAEVQDRDERLRMLDQATEYMDHALIELAPTLNAEKSPKRFQVEDWPREKSFENWSMVAGGTATSLAFARTCSSRDIPTSAVVIPGEERTNCKARSASESRPSASPTNSGRLLATWPCKREALAISVMFTSSAASMMVIIFPSTDGLPKVSASAVPRLN